ncbi:type I-E CRISPR-associated protein Cas7/Cse4/CasC [Streptomyces sp. NPDC055105]|uniref:type I-E CRISPR-associated protein Cas7/Cse4/CasC n=1 Tax=Streptomyces sp. NPDC055105 TaxID=3365719 RepID=UPI0037D82A1C
MTTMTPVSHPGHQFLSLHALIPLVAVLPVRDENGMPKEIVFGGEARNMITSQAERRADRTYARDRANSGEGHLAGYAMGIRTREWGRMTREELATRYGWDREQAMNYARAALTAIGLKFGDKDTTKDLSQVLIFAPQNAAEHIADILHTHRETLAPWYQDYTKAKEQQTKKKPPRGKKTEEPETDTTADAESDDKIPPLPGDLRAQILTALAPRDAVDIALYGRFLAEIADSPNIDGAIQTAHTFTVHAAEQIDDFYAAADDAKLIRKANPTALDFMDAADNAGAGMTGYQSLISGVFYRHAVLDRRQLRVNLMSSGMTPQTAENAALKAEHEIVDAFINAMPQAKKNSTASTGALPAITLAFDGKRPFSYAGAFCKAITEDNGIPATITAAERLLRHHNLIVSKRPDINAGAVLTYDLDIDTLIESLTADGVMAATPVNTVEELTAK